MQTFIKYTSNNLFFDFAAKEWTSIRADATAFPTSVEALRACLRAGLTHVRLVIETDENHCVVVPFE